MQSRLVSAIIELVVLALSSFPRTLARRPTVLDALLAFCMLFRLLFATSLFATRFLRLRVSRPARFATRFSDFATSRFATRSFRDPLVSRPANPNVSRHHTDHLGPSANTIHSCFDSIALIAFDSVPLVLSVWLARADGKSTLRHGVRPSPTRLS